MTHQFILRWLMRAFLTTVLCLGMPGQGPSACECVAIGTPSPSTRLAISDVVFVGRVVEVSLPGRWLTVGTEEPQDCRVVSKWEGMDIAYCEDEYAVVTLEVERSWKGLVKDRITLLTASSPTACGIDFHVGNSYLVYAKKRPDSEQLMTGTCDRTQHVSDARSEIAALGVSARNLVVERSNRQKKRQ